MLTIHRTLLAATLLASALAAAHAEVVLEQKIIEGSTTKGDIDVETHQVLTVAGMDIETTSTSFMEVTLEVGQRKSDGTLEIRQIISSLQAEAEFPGGIKLSFDSTNPSKPSDVAELEMVLDLYRALLEMTTTRVVDKNNRTQSVTASPEALQKVNELFRDQFDPAALKREAVQEEDRLPREPIDVGETWERTEIFNASGGSNLIFRREYKYEGTVERDGKTLDRITATTKSVTLDQAPIPASPLQITGSDLKVEDSSAELLFDRELGAVVSGDSSVHIAGTLKLTVNGQNLDGALDLTLKQKNTIKP